MGNGLETVETLSDFILWGPQNSLQIVIAAMKLKGAYCYLKPKTNPEPDPNSLQI